MLSLGIFGYIYAQVDPVPAGSDTEPVDLSQFSQAPVQLIQTSSISSNQGSDSAHQESISSNLLSGRTAMMINKLMLEEGAKKLEKNPGYTATFVKQELVDGVMSGNQVMSLKLKHSPFSVHLKWLVGDKGQELLYVDGENDGKMIVKAGGAKGRFLPPIKLDPNGSIARSKSRHPITKIGLVNLCKKLVENRSEELQKEVMEVKCQMLDNQIFENRECYCFVIEYDHKDVSPPYRKSVQYVDKEWLVPICIKNYNWPTGSTELSGIELDEKTLIENYSYSNIKMNVQLAEADFSKNALR